MEKLNKILRIFKAFFRGFIIKIKTQDLLNRSISLITILHLFRLKNRKKQKKLKKTKHKMKQKSQSNQLPNISKT